MTHMDDIEALADYYDQTDASDLLDREEVEIEADSDLKVSYSIRFDRPTIERIRAIAAAQGLGVTTLMRHWVEDRLGEAERPAGEEAAVTITETQWLRVFHTLERERASGRA